MAEHNGRQYEGAENFIPVPCGRTDDDLNSEVEAVSQAILEDYQKGRDIDNLKYFEQPDRDEVEFILNELLTIAFPGYYRSKDYHTVHPETKISVIVEDVMYRLRKQIELALLYDDKCAACDRETRKHKAKAITLEYFRQFPEIREYLDTDIEATFEGDPAANSKHEILLSYPGVLATAIYRLAHGLQRLNVPLIPRMMTEYSHMKTGVDIHPGAKIGKYFCIDHATGVVVGSTSIIGEHVKVYQGVTIGALSTKDGQKMHGTKRHPTIEDYVTLYSGASVLGGNTVIGTGAVIGGNAFVTKSVDPYTTVTIKTHEMVVDYKKHVKTEEKELEQDESWFYVI